MFEEQLLLKAIDSGELSRVELLVLASSVVGHPVTPNAAGLLERFCTTNVRTRETPVDVMGSLMASAHRSVRVTLVAATAALVRFFFGVGANVLVQVLDTAEGLAGSFAARMRANKRR